MGEQVSQIITYSEAMVMYFYAMTMVKPVLVTTCFKDHFCAAFSFVYCSHLSNQPKLVFIEN